MHITIPSVSTASDRGSTYEVYNVYVNGVYHSAPRYSAVHYLYNLVQKTCPSTVTATLPEFPSKKLVGSLSQKQLTERRHGLQKYLQAVAQHPSSTMQQLVNKCFFDFQLSTSASTSSEQRLVVCLGDEHKLCTVSAYEHWTTSTALQAVCDHIGMKREHISRFALFAVVFHEKTIEYVKWLHDFESPLITLRLGTKQTPLLRLLIQKCCWDVKVEQLLLNDRPATELLFAQADRQIRNGELPVSPELKLKLDQYREDQSYTQYVQMCHSLEQYGWLHLSASLSSYPNMNTSVQIRVGHHRIVLLYTEPITKQPVQSVFRVTRIRVWRIVTKTEDDIMHFEFEYFLGPDHFEWISLRTEQAAILSQCLQSMGAELVKEDTSNKAPAPAQTETIPVKNNINTPTNEPISTTNRYESFVDILRFGNRLSNEPAVFDRITDEDL